MIVKKIILLNTAIATVGNNWLSFDSSPPRKIWEVSAVTAINKTSKFSRLEFYVNHEHPQYGWLEYYFFRQNVPAKNILYTSEKIVYLSNGDYIDVLFSGCSASDELEVYLFGVEHIKPQGAII